MKNKLFKFASVLLCVLTFLSSVSVVATAERAYSSYTINVEDFKNPLYEESEIPSASTFSITPKRYFANNTFNPDIYVESESEIISTIRSKMVDRGASIDIYYMDEFGHNDSTMTTLIDRWIKEILAETANPKEGDYLAYNYSRIHIDRIGVIEYGADYYYHIPMEFNYYTTKIQEQAVDQKVEEVIADFNFSSNDSPKQKSDIIYNYITNNVTYDYNNLNNASYTLKFSTYAALINGTAVCQGYATLFYRLARECGLEARVVAGESYGEKHAWNIVKIGDYYYYADSTWDAGGKTDYYLNGSNSFLDSHTPESRFTTSEFKQKYPISSTNYDILEMGSLVDGDFEYVVSMGKATITKYNGKAKKLVIPQTVGGFPVKRLGQYAIMDNDYIQTLTFSEGITGMDIESVFGCHSLKQIDFPSTFAIEYEKFGDLALGGYSTVPNYCDSLEKITLSADNKSMKLVDGILYSYDMETVILCPAKYAKTKVVLPQTIVTIAPYSFYDCVNIKEIVMPDTVKYIGYWAFMNAASLEKADIPSACDMIGQFAYGGTKVSSVHIPASLDSILGGAFGANCDLKNITVDPQNVKFYMNGAALCVKYSDNNVALIDYATANTATSYTIPNEVTIIEQYALAHANNLKQIVVPSTVQSISPYAFESCTNLQHIEFKEGISAYPYGGLLYCYNLASVIFPSSMTTIDEFSFIGSDKDQFTIYAPSGSYANTYALMNNITFKPISEFICTAGHNMQKKVYDNYYQCVCKNCGDKSTVYWRTDIANAAYNAKTEQAKYVYKGTAIKPKIKSITEYDRELKEGVDYKIIGYLYNNAPGWGSIVIEGIGDFCGRGEVQFEIIPQLAATSKLSASLYGHNDVKLSWNKVSGAVGYSVYYKKTAASSYIYKADTTSCSYSFPNLSDNTSYTFKVCAYFKNGTKKEVSTNYKTVKISTLRNLVAPTKVTLSLYGYDDVNVSWSKVAYAKGYYVYYKKSTSKSYTYAGKTTATSFKKANLNDGVKYYFKIVPYGVSGSKIVLDSSYKTSSIYTLKQVSTPKVTKYSSAKAKVTWTNIAGESGYQISKSTKKSGTSIVSTYSTTTGKYKVISAKKGKGYYYKVRAFKKVGKKFIYGPWSTAKYYKLK